MRQRYAKTLALVVGGATLATTGLAQNQVITSALDHYDANPYALDFYQISTAITGFSASITFHLNLNSPWYSTWLAYTGPALNGYGNAFNSDGYGGKELVFLNRDGYQGASVRCFDASRRVVRTYQVGGPYWNSANLNGVDTNGNGVGKTIVNYQPYALMQSRPPATCVIVDDYARVVRNYQLPNMPIQAAEVIPAYGRPGKWLRYFYYDGQVLKHVIVDDYYRTVYYTA